MGTKRVITEEEKKIFKRYEDCLRWLSQGHIDGVCPECGQELVEKNGPYGLFITCSNPDCRFVIPNPRKPEEKMPEPEEG